MELVRQIFSTQPNVTSLNLEFSEIEEIDSLLPLLGKFPRLQELDLKGNRISRLPGSLASLKELEFLDLSNNMFPDAVSLLPALETIPKLEELIITVQNEEEEQSLIDSLPSLRKLNEMQVTKGEHEPPEDSHATESLEFDSSTPRLRQEDLEQVAILYDEIRAMWKKEDPDHDRVLGADFDAHVKEVMAELYEGVKVCVSPYIEHALMFQAKFDLFEICFQKIAEFAGTKDEEVGRLLGTVKQAHAQIIVELVGIVSNAVPKMQQKMVMTKSEMDKSLKETSEVLEAAEQLEKENSTLKADLERLKENWEKEKEELTMEIEGLKEENQRCLDTLIKHSKATATSALSRSQEVVVSEAPSARYTPSTNIASARLTVANIQGRNLSLKQLKDVIDEIYVSKSKFDQRCAEGKLPRETMEQHMYTFLNQKYGLKVYCI